MIEWCERTQSKAILGGTLTSQADGKTSTNALGNVSATRYRKDLRDADAKLLAKTPVVTWSTGLPS
ncbi:phage portal protein family protein [Pseudomonas aeruginosa]